MAYSKPKDGNWNYRRLGCRNGMVTSQSFFAPEGVGALHISEYRKLEAEVTEEDLREFIEEPLREQVTPFSSAGFSGFQSCYTDDKGFWRNWLLRSGTSMLFVTYNCEITAADLEEQNVLTIVRSISPRT